MEIYVLYLINLVFSIIAYIYLFKVYFNTLVDPFQQYFGFEEKKNFFNDYFKEVKPNENVDYYNDCYYYQDSIMDRNTEKLSAVFQTNIGKLNMSTFIMIIIVSFLILRIGLIFLVLIMIGITYICPACSIITLFCVKINKTLSTIYNIISGLYGFSFFYSIYLFYSGDINTYFDFLSCKNVNYDGFEKYRSIEIVKYDFKRFMIFSFISLGFSCIYSGSTQEAENRS